MAAPVGAAEVDGLADGVTETVGLGTADGVALVARAVGVGVAGALVRAGALPRDGRGAGALLWLPCAGPSRFGGWTG